MLNESDLDEIYDILENLERKKRDRQAQALMQKSYEKRPKYSYSWTRGKC